MGHQTDAPLALPRSVAGACQPRVLFGDPTVTGECPTGRGEREEDDGQLPIAKPKDNLVQTERRSVR